MNFPNKFPYFVSEILLPPLGISFPLVYIK